MEFNENLRSLIDVLFNVAEANEQKQELAQVKKFRTFSNDFVLNDRQKDLIGLFSDFYSTNKDEIESPFENDGEKLNDAVFQDKEIVSTFTKKEYRLPFGKVYSKSSPVVKLKLVYFFLNVLRCATTKNEKLVTLATKIEDLLPDESESGDEDVTSSMARQMSEMAEKTLGQKIDPNTIQSTISNLFGKETVENVMRGFEKSRKDIGSGAPIADVISGFVGQLQPMLDSMKVGPQAGPAVGASSSSGPVPQIANKKKSKKH